MRDELNPPAIVARADAELGRLAAQINAEHEAGEQSQRKGLQHYRAAGVALLKAKADCGHGKWLGWLRDNVRFTPRRAQHYMELAKCEVTSHLADEWQRISGNATPPEEEPPAPPPPPATFSAPDLPFAEVAAPARQTTSNPPVASAESESIEDENPFRWAGDDEDGVSEDAPVYRLPTAGHLSGREDCKPPAGLDDETVAAASAAATTKKHPRSDRLKWWLARVLDGTLAIEHDFGTIGSMLSAADEVDWDAVKSYVLPMLRTLGQTITQYAKEVEDAVDGR